MKTVLIAVLLLGSMAAYAQFNESNKKLGIIKYDYSTYTGDPIKTGWLFDDETYRKLYKSYNAADTMMVYFEKQMIRFEEITKNLSQIRREYETKAKDDRDMILKQQETIGQIKTSFDSSIKDNEKILKQFWRIGGVRLHKGTGISVGISALVLGYMVGKAF